MTTCGICDGQGMVCDDCGQGDIPVRLSEYGELCKGCLETILDEEDSDETIATATDQGE
jgi:hypothetical protein